MKTRWMMTAALLALGVLAHAQEPKAADIQQSMKRATAFMFDKLSNQGGFVWWYEKDGFTPYGELKARPSMIWVEPPSTPSVGLALLEAYKATKDGYYLACAEKVAGALIRGQNPSGGWHYFIDFDPAGLPAYHAAFFSKCWGWQEYLPLHTNCTFDDYTTTEPTRFLLRLNAVSPKPEFAAARDKALQHILRAQGPQGGWPQRFPKEPGTEDYSSCYTLNDDVVLDCIHVLWEASDALNSETYRAAARRGMDFYVRSQLPAPQPGWVQQYDEALRPAKGRPFELATLCSQQTYTCMVDLMHFYELTGDKKYLKPIPAALEWLEKVRFKDGKDFTHTYFYEMGTDKPVYVKQSGTVIDDVKFTPTYTAEGCYPYGDKITLPLDTIRTQYQQCLAGNPEQAMAAYQKRQSAAALPEALRGHYMARVMAAIPQSADAVRGIVESQDALGGWVEKVTILDPFAPFSKPGENHEGYTTGGYIARMYRMINQLKQEKP